MDIQGEWYVFMSSPINVTMYKYVCFHVLLGDVSISVGELLSRLIANKVAIESSLLILDISNTGLLFNTAIGLEKERGGQEEL